MQTEGMGIEIQLMRHPVWKRDVLTCQLGPFLVHIHQDSIDGRTHLQVKKAPA